MLVRSLGVGYSVSAGGFKKEVVKNFGSPGVETDEKIEEEYDDEMIEAMNEERDALFLGCSALPVFSLLGLSLWLVFGEWSEKEALEAFCFLGDVLQGF